MTELENKNLQPGGAILGFALILLLLFGVPYLIHHPPAQLAEGCRYQGIGHAYITVCDRQFLDQRDSFIGGNVIRHTNTTTEASQMFARWLQRRQELF